MSNQDQNDKDLEAYLRGDSKLSRAYQNLHKVQTPSALDKTILAAAHRGIDKQSTTPKKIHASSPFSGRWAVPASLAAVLVVSVSLVTLTYEKLPTSLDETGIQESPDLKSRALKSGAPELLAPKKEQVKSYEDDHRGVTTQSAPALEQATDAPQPRQTMGKQSAPAARHRENEMPLEERIDAYSAPPPHRVKEAKQEKAKKKINAASPAPAASFSTVRPQTTGRTVAPAAVIKKDGNAITKRLLPEKWLDQIKKLIANGKQVEADKSLAEFRRQYPDFPWQEYLQK